MKILLISHAAWRHTGYGTPVRPFVKEMRKHGHDVAVLAVEERGPGSLEYTGITHFLPNRSRYGEDVAAWCADVCKADVVVSLLDAWVFAPGNHFGGRKWLAWTPVDQYPAPAPLIERLKGAAVSISFSQWGANKLRERSEALVIKSISLGVDTKIYSPVSLEERATLRQQFVELPESAFVVGMVGANLPGDRKALEQNIAGFCYFASRHPEANLLLWTGESGGISLDAYLEHFGDVGKRVICADQWAVAYGTNPKTLATFYNSLDVLLNASAAEGFGLPIIEAMACGVPVIGTDNTSMPELITDRVGWLVQDTEPEWTRLNGWWQRPTVYGVINTLERAYADLKEAGVPTGPSPYQSDCVGWAHAYDWELIGEQWHETLEAL